MSQQYPLAKIKNAEKDRPIVLHWSKRKHHPWHSCCDTRAVVAIFLLLHEENESYYISYAEVVDFIRLFFSQRIVFDGAVDLKSSFSGQSQNQTSEHLVEVILALVKDEVLEPDKTEGLIARFRLVISVKRDLQSVYWRMAKKKQKSLDNKM